MNWLRALVCALWLAGALAGLSQAQGGGKLDDELEATRKKLDAAKEKARGKLEAAARRAEHESAKTAEDLRRSVANAREQGQQVLEDAQQAMVRAGEQLKSALDDVKGVGDRAARSQAARRSAWQRFTPHAKRPSDIPPSARVELRIHSRRMARLARIRALAEYEHDQAMVQRADSLTEREQVRHRAALAQAWPALTDPKARAEGDDDQDSKDRPREDDDDPESEP